MKNRNFLSRSGCGGYRSAFKELYRQCNVTMEDMFEKELTKNFRGLQKPEHVLQKERTRCHLRSTSFSARRWLQMVHKGLYLHTRS